MFRSDLRSGAEMGGQRYSGESPVTGPGWESFVDSDGDI